MTHTGRALLIVAAVALAASAAPAEEIRLAGDDGANWLMMSQGEHYELAAGVGDKPWKKVTGRVKGLPKSFALIDGEAAVLFTEGGQIRYRIDGYATRTVDPGKDLWPKGTSLLASCPSGEAGKLLVLVTRRRPVATSRPAGATQPASPPANSDSALEMALLTTDRNGWEQIAVRPLADPVGHGFLARRGKTIYALLEGDRRTLLALQGGSWRELPLPNELTNTRPIALVSVADRIVLATYNHPTEGQLSLAVLTGEALGPLIPVRRGETAQQWAQSPAVSRRGKKIALLWLEDKTHRLATCDTDAVISGKADDIFAASRVTDTVDQIWSGLVLALPIAVFVLAFWPGQPARTAPFQLPDRMKPGDLLRRIVAGMIDLGPFLLIFSLAAGPVDADTAMESVTKMEPLPARVAIAAMGLLLCFPLYGLVLESLYGATLGKRVMKLRVVGDGGRKPTFREILLRNVTKALELRFIIFLLLILLSKRRRRFGDLVAWTAVVSTELAPEGPSDPNAESTDGDRDSGEDKPG